MKDSVKINKRFSVAGLLGLVTLLGAAMGMMRLGISSGNQGPVEDAEFWSLVAASGFLILLGTTGGVVGFLLKGQRGIFLGAVFAGVGMILFSVIAIVLALLLFG